MADIILKAPDVISKTVSPESTHLVFLLESGTKGVLIQMCNNKKDTNVEANWRTTGRIGPTSEAAFTLKQALAIFAAKGYVYRVIIEGANPANTDTEVSYGQQTEAQMK